MLISEKEVLMRKLLFFGLSVIYMLAMTFCAYTPLVNNYINNEDNYVEIDAKFLSAEFHEEGYSYLNITLTDFYRYHGFTGHAPENYDDSVLENTVITIKIVPESALLLKERGLFDEIPSGTPIRVRTTCWIYDGIQRHYLGAVSTSEIELLTFEEGMDGVRAASTKLKDIEISEILKPKK